MLSEISNKNRESDWHVEWKNNFSIQEYEILKHKGGFKDRRADALVYTKTLEFQHSYISLTEINERTYDHKINGLKTYWIVDCTINALQIDKLENDICLIKFTNNDNWRFESFKNCNHIYLDYNDVIYKIKPKYVRQRMVYTNKYTPKKNFIRTLKKNERIFSTDKIPQCKIYFNQRGAGCGKTYESIQLLNSDTIFREKTFFIYLTKMHSAKEVIKKEFMEQLENGKLQNIEEWEDEYHNKQHRITFTKNEKECKMIIATIDAFMYRLGDKNNTDSDFFRGIITSIKSGYESSNRISMAGTTINLSKQTLIIIDEAQDLSPEYIEAISKKMLTTHYDCYVIGDKLQSIWGENNVFTFLEKNDFLYPIKIVKSIGTNKVRRFHNEKFINFVNNIIDFKKYNLPIIEEICSDKECKYKHINTEEPYKIFEIPTIYTSEKELSKLENTLNKIEKYIRDEITNNKYLPNNFMFIFPYLKNNLLANELEPRLQKIWKEIFEDINYYNDVVAKNKYWKENYDKDKYIQFVYFHKGNEGQSINLRESENASRILSIHASKGSGCEVVFLLGINEQSLHFYSSETGSLQYDSLLHVAITRQKMKLYVGLINNGCDIYRRFNTIAKIEHDENIEPLLNNISNHLRLGKISGYCLLNNFETMNEIFFISSENNKFNSYAKRGNNIVEWGHHIIRNAVFKYRFLSCIYNNEKYDDEKDQFKTILNKITKKKVTLLTYNEYFKTLDEILKNKNKHESSPEKKDRVIKCKNLIPVLFYESHRGSEYIKYKDIIVSVIENVILKISDTLRNNKLPELCPIESVLLWHVISILNHGKYSEISIMDIYNIINCYNTIYSKKNNHDDINCKCGELFTNNIDVGENIYVEIQQSKKNHYEKIQSVTELYTRYKQHVEKHFCESFTYNVMHFVNYLNTGKLNITKDFWLIAYSENYVINFIFRPEINKINFNEIYTSLIFDHHIIFNGASKKNNDRYKGKKIIHCVLSLNMSETKPIFYDINEIYTKNVEYTRGIFKNAIICHYKEHTKLLFRCFNFLNKKFHGRQQKLTCIRDYIQVKYMKMPHYVFLFIDNIVEKLKEGTDCSKYNKIFKDELFFTIEMNDKMVEFINNVLDIVEYNDSTIE